MSFRIVFITKLCGLSGLLETQMTENCFLLSQFRGIATRFISSQSLKSVFSCLKLGYK